MHVFATDYSDEYDSARICKMIRGWHKLSSVKIDNLVIAFDRLNSKSHKGLFVVNTPCLPPEDLFFASGERLVARFTVSPPSELTTCKYLIRIFIGARIKYPLRDLHLCGGDLTFPSFEALLAHIFFHELYHYQAELMLSSAKDEEREAERYAFHMVTKKCGFSVKKKQTIRHYRKENAGKT